MAVSARIDSLPVKERTLSLPADHFTEKSLLLERLYQLSKNAKYVLDFKEDFGRLFSRSFNNYLTTDRQAKSVADDIRSRNEIYYYWTRAAENLYSEIDIRNLIEIKDVNNQIEVHADEQEILYIVTRIYSNPQHVPSDRMSMFYRIEVGSPMFNVFFSSFLDALKKCFEEIVDNVEYEPKKIAEIINSETLREPLFREFRGKISYYQTDIDGQEFSERKKVVSERCRALQETCKTKGNEQPELKEVCKEYAQALKSLRRERGAYRVFIAGMRFESLIRVKASLPSDADRNVPLDAGLLFAVQSLIIAHAGLIALFPDAQKAAEELDRYTEQSVAIDALRERVLDPVLDSLAQSRRIFDDNTIELTQSVRRLGDREAAVGLTPSRQVTSVKHGWVRGALGAIGRLVLSHLGEIAKEVREAEAKEAASNLSKSVGTLTGAIVAFLVAAEPVLLRIADSLTATFGWLRQLLSHLRLLG
jgi:hypothetical protein